MKKTTAVYVVSLGCAKNLVDTEVMCGALVTQGFYLAADPEDADAYLINTCGFIRDAKEESYQEIKEALKWKDRSKKLVIVAGCLSQRYPAELAAKFPGIDLIIGLDEIQKLPELIRQAGTPEGRIRVSSGLPQYLYTHQSPRITLTPPPFAYVKVAEGCDHRCAYCAIPLIRGNQRSREISSVMEECSQLLAQGAKELNFIAQDTSRYGTDLKNGENLEKLLRNCDSLDGDFWIRVLYTHPLHLTDGLLDVLTHSKHVLPYLDIPLQHISTPVLHAMKRGMDGEKTRTLLENIRKSSPEMSIRTTFLVGFPGETEEDFQTLLDFVKYFKFDRLGVFTFSPEEGTPAASMDAPQVPPELAEERKNMILEAQQAISLEKNKAAEGTQVQVLLENKIGKKKWEGRTKADAPDVDQVVTVTTLKDRQEDGFIQAKIIKAGEYGFTAAELPR